jgi:uncharacterized protein YdhG (YjbR/CyaY superfamily)
MDNKVAQYIEKQKPFQKEICKTIRSVILKTFPNINEEMKWGVPSYKNGKYYFVALKDHVNIGFSIKGLSKEELALFSGNGKTMRVIEIKSLKDIDEKELIKLLKLVK